MENTAIDEVRVTDDDLRCFDTFITLQEVRRVGYNDGVFKIIVDSNSVVTSPLCILKQTLQSMGQLHQQNLLKGDANDIYIYKRRSASEQAETQFREACSNMASFNQSTCCTEKLSSEGVDGLIRHYFDDIVKSSCTSHSRANSSYSSLESRKKNLLKEGEEMRQAYLQSRQEASNIDRETNCSCRDCDEESGGESDSDIDKERTNNIYYAPGITLKRRKKDPLFITKHFSLSKLKNILQVLKKCYDGIACSMMYFGGVHSFFPIHIEDTALWSLNFLPFGAPKLWVIIPPRALYLVMYHLMKSGLSVNNTSCINFLGHKTAFASTAWLKQRGIPFKIVVQWPGEGIILYPNAVHFGFNAGWNLAEAINFGTVSWIPHGINYPKCLCYKGTQIHMDLSGLIAAFRPDLLDKYLQRSFIPTENTYDMACVLAKGIETCSVAGSDTFIKNSEHGGVKKKASSTSAPMAIHQKCPVSYCTKSYAIERKIRLFNHVLREHKPIVEKMQLLQKIDIEYERLKAELKKEKKLQIRTK